MRESRGISRKELAEGICSESNLGRIERGLVQPYAFNLERLLEKLGQNPNIIVGLLVDEITADFNRIRQKLDFYLMNKRIDEAEILINRLKGNQNFVEQMTVQQYILMNEANLLIIKGERSPKIYGILMEAIKITTPALNIREIGTRFCLTKQDIRIINMMAILHYNDGELDEAIDIMYGLKQNMDRRFHDSVSKGGTYSLIIYNLAKYLGMAGRYDEAIKLCDFGKIVCIESGALWFIPMMLYNKAWCLHEMGKLDEYAHLVRQAYMSAIVFEQHDHAETIKIHAKRAGMDLDDREQSS